MTHSDSNTDSEAIPRKIVLPVVLGVWAGLLLVGVYTMAFLPWFTDYYDHHGAQLGLEHATIAVAFRHGHPVGAMLAAAIVIFGGLLMRWPNISSACLIWYLTGAIISEGTWFLWMLLIERNIYLLALPN